MSTDPCGEKHRKWLALIVGIVLAICTGTIVYCHTTVSGLEVRVRQVEQNSAANDAANAARFEAIRESLHRLEAKGP